MTLPISTVNLSLEGQVAIVTGGGTGIGRGIALELARAGADIVAASRTLSKLEKVIEEIGALGRRSLAVPTDVSKKSDVDNLVSRATREFGNIDILVNCAGIGNFGGKNAQWSVDLPEDWWDRMIDINLKGCHLCSQAVAKGMIERKKGNIINISSINAILGGGGPYGVSKAGLVRFTAGLARDLGQYNIRVNAIAPGYIRVEVGVVINEEEKTLWNAPETLQNIPLGRVGEPPDIGTVALFLASEASNYVTGQTIIVDGGLTPRI